MKIERCRYFLRLLYGRLAKLGLSHIQIKMARAFKIVQLRDPILKGPPLPLVECIFEHINDSH